MKGIVYIITNKTNGKVYIGQTIQPLAQRIQRHFCLTASSEPEMCMAIKRAVKVYGKDNFSVSVLEECESSLLNEREQFYIRQYNSYENGYNCTIGGDCGRPRVYFTESVQKDIIDLYNIGFSLRELGREYGVAKQTIKHVLLINNIPLRQVRSYKLSSEHRNLIISELLSGIERKTILIKWNISKSYLSQLASGFRRI